MKLAEKSKLERASFVPGKQRHRSERLLISFLEVTRPAGDLLALNLAFLAAYFLRYIVQVGGEVPGEFYVPYQDYVPVEVAMTAIMMVTYALKGTYRLPKGSSWLTEASSILSSTSIGVMVLFAAVSMFRYPASSRLLFIYLWLLAVVLVSGVRLLHRLETIALRKRGVGIERILVVGGGNVLGRRIMHSIVTERSLVAQVIGFVDLDPCDDFGRFRYLGSVTDVPLIVEEQLVDTIVIALPAASHDQVLGIMDHCQRRGVKFRVVPDLYQMRLHRVDADTINGIPLIAVSESRIRGWNLLLKRLMDVSLAVLTLTMLSPVLGLIAMAIKLDSEGPVLFRQTRTGKDGHPFTLYKYRSMKQDAEKDLPLLWEHNEVTGPIFKIRDDPRMTRVGKWIRRASLDELPQLVNVVKGEMSLVGPRPPLPREVDKYEDWHLKRLDAPPGITGLWQVSGRSEIPFDEMVMLDIYYIENWSLGLDLTILLRTIPAVLTGGGAF